MPWKKSIKSAYLTDKGAIAPYKGIDVYVAMYV